MVQKVVFTALLVIAVTAGLARPASAQQTITVQIGAFIPKGEDARVAGDVLTIPDYKGNRYFNTLGNLVSDPRASLAFVGFDDGTLLQLQGATEIVWDAPEVRSFEGAERLWRFRVARAWRRRHALPLRWRIRYA